MQKDISILTDFKITYKEKTLNVIKAFVALRLNTFYNMLTENMFTNNTYEAESEDEFNFFTNSYRMITSNAEMSIGPSEIYYMDKWEDEKTIPIIKEMLCANIKSIKTIDDLASFIEKYKLDEVHINFYDEILKNLWIHVAKTCSIKIDDICDAKLHTVKNFKYYILHRLAIYPGNDIENLITILYATPGSFIDNFLLNLFDCQLDGDVNFSLFSLNQISLANFVSKHFKDDINLYKLVYNICVNKTANPKGSKEPEKQKIDVKDAIKSYMYGK